MYKILINIILLIQIKHCLSGYAKNPSDECLNRIYRECSHESSFTEEEVENVRIYLQKRFAKTNPKRKACERIHVRKDIKCMAREEVNELIDAMKTLYANGFIDRMTEIHANVWSAVHKFGEGLSWHRWFLNVFENELHKINPNLFLPYWQYFTDFAEPERSVVFEYFGRGGDPNHDYCVMDGPFANLTVNYPTPHCLKRQWNKDGSIEPWEAPEWTTAFTQMGFDYPILLKELAILANWSTIETIPRSLKKAFIVLTSPKPTTKPWSQFALMLSFVAHFKSHLALGGWAGDLSVTFAPNDPLFYIFHGVSADLGLLRWQLSDDENLVPNDYELGVKYDWALGRTALADIQTDVLSYYTDVSVKETFQVGFGDLCYIHDVLIKPINELMRNHYRPLPEAYHRLKSALPQDLFEMYFPKFAFYPNKVTAFDYILPNVGECNRVCRPTPVAKRFVETDAGLRVWNRFRNDLGFDLTLIIRKCEKSYERFMRFINQYNYCSPYVL